MTKALLLGASGLTGRHCLTYLLANPAVNDVGVITRRPLGVEHSSLHEAHFDAPDLDQFMAGYDVLLICLGTTLKKVGSKAAFEAVDLTLCVDMARRAKQAGIPTCVTISAVNAKSTAVSFYARTKGKMEQALRALQFPHLVLVQPSLLIGDRDERRFAESLGQQLAKPFTPLMGKMKLASTPIRAQQLARAMVNVALAPVDKSVLVLRYSQLIDYANKET